MQKNRRYQRYLKSVVMGSVLAFSPLAARCQNEAAPSTPAAAELATDLKSLAASVSQLQSQVQSLNAQMTELHRSQQEALAEAEQLRAELNRTREPIAAKSSGNAHAGAAGQEVLAASSPALSMSGASASAYSSSSSAQQGQTPDDLSQTSLQQRISKLEDDQELLNDKIIEQSQTKVESGSKYRVRLSGIVLLNTAVTRGSVDNLDFPQIAQPEPVAGVTGAFSGSLRQSQIGIEAFGPDIAGARTSANVKFDFAGGFANTPNGDAFGVVRLRTGTIRLDWTNTSVVAGQDALFFAPLTPTSLSSLAIPALSYTGNLWGWTPQVRIEHRVGLTENSGLLFQAGILDSLTGDTPEQGYRYPTVGEQSGQPAYAMHIAYDRHVFGREFSVGMGGYYGRQNWAYSRNVDGWAAVADVAVPLGNFFALSGEFYRGRGVGGLGGGIGQSIVLSGPITSASTTIYGLDSEGGWAQLKFKPRDNFEVNFAYGQDAPFARELRLFPASSLYYGGSLSRNLSPFVNFIYRVRSDMLFSVEYKRLQTYTLDSYANNANQLIMSAGYTF
jgi:cell division protein FtsB